MIVEEAAVVPPPTHRLAAGSYDKPLEEVTPGFLTVLFGDGWQRRAGCYARVPQNFRTPNGPGPLADRQRQSASPRVIVNRIWQEHFGRGLIANANDFGTQTAPPVHPELLDWLASEFMNPTHSARPWSLKALHRLILTSAAYRQAAEPQVVTGDRARGEELDPANRLYWHFDRRRLTAESIRDAFLSVAGVIEPTLYGPSVHPELPGDLQ